MSHGRRCQDSLEMSPLVDVFVGMRTEAKPCTFGRSGRAHANERRCHSRVRNPWLHVLITLPPRMVWLGFPHHNRPGSRRKWWSGFSYRGANNRCYCRYVAESSSATKRQSQQGASLAKVEPRAPRHERRRVAVADVAEKIRFHMSFREKLLLAGLTFASRKELLIEFCVIKA
jgi:hypothetical protein